MDKYTFTELLDKYIQGRASEAEKKLLEAYYEQLVHQRPAHLKEGEDEMLRKEMLAAILSTIQKAPARPAGFVNKRVFFIRIAAAAAVLIFIVAGVFLIQTGKHPHNDSIVEVPVQQKNKPVVHGTDKAILTLDNGSAIELDSAGNGTLAQQGNSVITKTGGHLLYGPGKISSTDIVYNVLTTPKGGQYHVTLSDGTEVWLNASSSIRYPTSFTTPIRNVEITGEAYFEVAKNPSRPFHVQVNDMTVEVLGTHFNIMAYSDEATINTTLLEGSVKVWGDKKSGLLQPGQQSRFNRTLQSISVGNADTEKAVAWKNGMLMFKRDDIRTIMRQVSRWYDVEISYNGEMPSRLYSGSISKYVNVSEVLKILELGGIKFRMEGNRITVLN